VHYAQQAHGISERRACRLVDQPRGTQRLIPIHREDEDQLAQAIIQLAVNTDAMDIAGSRRYCNAPAGK